VGVKHQSINQVPMITKVLLQSVPRCAQHNVMINCIRYLQQVGCFLWIFWFTPLIYRQTTSHLCCSKWHESPTTLILSYFHSLYSNSVRKYKVVFAIFTNNNIYQQFRSFSKYEEHFQIILFVVS
jgi:hypothetical protein